MMKQISYIVPFSLLALATSMLHAQTAGTAGAFARMGFGARGMAMGNALTAVIDGDIGTYYNPALSPFEEYRTATATFGILSLDRNLNFLSYTQSVKPTAGLSFGLINAGVHNIDGRNSDGVHTEDYSTFENQFYLSFANRVSDNVSLGVAIKLYYSKLFDKVTSTTVGFDAGGLIKLTDELSVGIAVKDIGSKYKWDTKEVYSGPDAKTTEDQFPMLRRIGIAYRLPSRIGTISAEFENSSEKTNIVRFGAEYDVVDNFAVRGGLDRWDFSDEATGVKPSFGFSVRSAFGGWTPALTYAFVTESFAPTAMHIITLSTWF
jgi:hypothetical protein